MTTNKPLVSLQAICQILKLTSRRVQQLISDGTLPKPEGTTKAARYDLIGCVWAYFTMREEKIRQTTAKGKVDDEIKQVELQAKQFKLDREKGFYLLRAAVADELVKRTYTIKHDQLALERRLNRYPDAKEIVKKAHRQMWRNYSRKQGVFKDGK